MLLCIGDLFCIQNVVLILYHSAPNAADLLLIPTFTLIACNAVGLHLIWLCANVLHFIKKWGPFLSLTGNIYHRYPLSLFYMSMVHIQHLFTLSSKMWKVAHLSLQCSNKLVCVFLLARYTDGQPTENAEWFCKWLEEASTDFSYGKTYLKGLRCAMFGLGNSVYGSHYNMVRDKNVDKWLWMLSGICVLSRGDSNCKVVKTHNGSAQADFLVWKTKFLNCMQALVAGQKKACSGNCKTDGSCKTRNRKKPQEKTEDDQAYPEQLRYHPGVKICRLLGCIQSGMHCTLSLVGEPIMYPKMNAFLYLLHTHRVSGFIVTDTQFPQEIRWGYCSYDEDISKYQPPSPLSPSLPVPLSLQGVTYCGESHPFVQQLADMLPNYQIACKHEHSNCLHIVHTKLSYFAFIQCCGFCRFTKMSPFEFPLFWFSPFFPPNFTFLYACLFLSLSLFPRLFLSLFIVL
uniref:Flavodoxin-like domain-containing protein n=1 Tax=Oncorhynchus tshawytscha TaxID=74940 RepID=A0AAZ3QFW7_ONCTS